MVNADRAELVTATQAAEALSASTQSIRNWVREGRLAGVRIGNRFLIPRREIERLRGGVAPTGESPWSASDDDPPVALPRARAGEAADALVYSWLGD